MPLTRTCSLGIHLGNDQRQIHHLVNGTVEVIGASSAKWPNLRTIIAVKDLIHARCPRLYRWPCHTIHPTAIFDLMWRDGIVHKSEHLPFMKGDRILDETQSPHMHRWDDNWAGLFNAARGDQYGEQTPNNQTSEQLLQHHCLLIC